MLRVKRKDLKKIPYEEVHCPSERSNILDSIHKDGYLSKALIG